MPLPPRPQDSSGEISSDNEGSPFGSVELQSPVVSLPVSQGEFRENDSVKENRPALTSEAMTAAAALMTVIGDDECTEVLLNGPNEILKKVGGARVHVASIRFGDADTYHQVLNEVLLPWTDTLDRIDGFTANIEGQLELPSGNPDVPPTLARVHMLAPPFGGVSVAKVTIAKKARYAFTLDTLPQTGSMSPNMGLFLKAAVRGRMTIVVSGPGGAGKCLTGRTPIRLADGTSVSVASLVDPLVETAGVSTADGVVSAPGSFEVVAFDSERATFCSRPVHAVHRRVAPSELTRLRLSTGLSVTCTPEHGVFAFREGTVVKVPARYLVPGDVLFAPAGELNTDVTDPNMFVQQAAGTASGQFAGHSERGYLSVGGARLPTVLTRELAWLLGVTAAVASREFTITASGAVVLPVPESLRDSFLLASRSVFGVAGGAVPKRRAVVFAHPSVIAFLVALGVLDGPVLTGLPGWLRRCPLPVFGDVLSGLLDTAGHVGSARGARLDVRFGNSRFAESILAVYQARGWHGMVLTKGGAAGWSNGVRLTGRYATEVAKHLSPTRETLTSGLEALIAAHDCDDMVLAGNQAGIIAGLLTELALTHGVARAHELAGEAMGVSDRTVRRYADGSRPVLWRHLTALAAGLPRNGGPVGEALAQLDLDGTVPVRVDSVHVVANNGPGREEFVYDLSVDDPDCRAFLAAGIAVSNSTVLQAMTYDYDMNDRVVVVEDTRELNLPLADVVYMKSTFAGPGVNAATAVSTEWLVKIANRMRMDRIIVGECRGGELAEWLIAANSGAEGSATTVHAHSPRRTLDKMVNLGMKNAQAGGEQTIRREIAATVDLIVQAGLVDGRYVILAIEEVSTTVRENGVIGTQTLFQFDRATGQHQPVTLPSKEFQDRLRAHGVNFDAQSLFRR